MKDLDLTHEISYVKLLSLVSVVMTKLKEKNIITDEEHTEMLLIAMNNVQRAQKEGLF